ncbi:MAG: histidine kinase [Spirosomataceae bacterium]
MAGKIENKLGGNKNELQVKISKPKFTYNSFLITFLFLLWSSKGISQHFPYTFTSFKMDGNALDNIILCMLKDSQGYLWLGTVNGLKRYDSYINYTYRKERGNKNSLINNYIETLAEDKQGRIWVGTTEGVCYFDRKTNQFTRIEELNKPDFACRNIICDSKGDIWFTIRDGGLYKFDTKTNKLTNFRNNPSDRQSISFNRILIHGLLEDPFRRGLWVACADKLNFFDFQTQRFYHAENNPQKIPILTSNNKSALAIDNNLLVYSDNSQKEISWYDTRQHKIVKTYKAVDKKGNRISDCFQIFIDSNHDIWVSTDEPAQLAYIDAKLTKTIMIDYEKGSTISFPSNTFNGIIQEKNGTIWFATSNGLSSIKGVDVLNPNEQPFSYYDFSKTLFKDKIMDGFTNFFEDKKDSTWWFTTQQNRICHYLPKTNYFQEWNVPSFTRNKGYDFISITSEYEDEILLFKPFEFYIFNKKKHDFYQVELPKPIREGGRGLVFHAKRLGDSVWVFSKSLMAPVAYNYHLRRKKWADYPIIYGNAVKLNKTRDVGVSASLVTKSGDFWLAIHSGGLAKYNPKIKGFEVIKTKQDIDFTKVGYTGFDEDKEGNIWIASYDLIKFNPKTYDFKSVLDLDFITSMIIDDHDNICMSMADEVVIYNEKKGENSTYNYMNYDANNNWNIAFFKMQSNKILSLNRQSAIQINFSDNKTPSSNDQLCLNMIRSPDTTVFINMNNLKVKFKTDENSFAIFYGVVSLPNANFYDYYYQLVGYDKDWQKDTHIDNSNYARYSNIEGGDYLFKVKAIDNNGKALPEKWLYIHIDTIFYKTTWFKALCALLSLFTLGSFMRYRADQRKKIHHLQLQSTRLAKDKTEIQYQNLINHLNPHFLFNSLASLNSLILTEPRQASKFLQKLSAIYRYILQNKEKESVTLEHELNFVKNYIELQKSRFEEGLLINIDIDEEYLGDGIVPVTLQNLFENAIKHNIITDENPLRIDVYIDGDFLIVKNNLQRKSFVETSNKQGLDSLKKLYEYLSRKPLETLETEGHFIVKVPLL